MKNAKKILALLLCAVLLVGASVAGTLAYLTSQDVVTNTFAVGNVIITMDELDTDSDATTSDNVTIDGVVRDKANAYKLIPGHTYIKDPIIRVAAGSEACWLFVKIENGNTNATINGLDTNGWTQIVDTNYWAYAGATIGENSTVPVFNSFTYASTVTDTATDATTTIKVTAYAIQADGFGTSELAWDALKTQLSLS